MAKILVVDDEATMLELVRSVLYATGHEVVCTDDPERAAAIALDEAPDVVVLDVMMPRRSGFDVLDDLKREVLTRHIPVVLLTTKSDARDRVHGLRAGAEDYLGKPFDPQELALRVERLAESRRKDTELAALLEVLPLSDVLQCLEHRAVTGTLVVGEGGRRGSIDLESGRIVEARDRRLKDRSALLALLGRSTSSLQWTTAGEAPASVGDRPSLSLSEMLMDAAWLEDELAARIEHLPDPDCGLEPGAGEVPEEEPWTDLPLQALLRSLWRQPGSSLRQLEEQQLASPLEIRLALAVLVEHRAVLAQRSSFPGPELESSLESIVSDAVRLREVVGPGRGEAIDVLLVAAPSRKKDVVAFHESLPGGAVVESPPGASAILESGGTCCIKIGARDRPLSVRLIALGGTVPGNLADWLRQCLMVAICSDGGEDAGEMSMLSYILEEVRPQPRSVVLAPEGTTDREAVADLFPETPIHGFSTAAPQAAEVLRVCRALVDEEPGSRRP